nr:hypothetical protein MFMH1_72240 [Myxococcus sp. MH1]
MLAFCWAHVRRKFFEAKQFAPACEEVLRLIAEMYAIEADLPGWYALTAEERQTALAQRLAVRQQRSAPVVASIRQWALAQRAAPGSAFRKALEYMLKLWDGLTVFLGNPVVPIDNNHVERQMRDMVMGRKNHYGSKSKRGTEVAALFYSLIETARLRGEDPGRYLQRAALASIENPGSATLPKGQAWRPLLSVLSTGQLHTWTGHGEQLRALGHRFATPDDKHLRRKAALLAQRHQMYQRARRRHPDRWSRSTRDWTPAGPVRLNPAPCLTPLLKEGRHAG